MSGNINQFDGDGIPYANFGVGVVSLCYISHDDKTDSLAISELNKQEELGSKVPMGSKEEFEDNTLLILRFYDPLGIDLLIKSLTTLKENYGKPLSEIPLD